MADVASESWMNVGRIIFFNKYLTLKQGFGEKPIGSYYVKEEQQE